MSNQIDNIRSLLSGGVSERPAEVLALEYAAACRKANERLGRVVEMLDAGGEIEALQAAEQAPRLVDLVGELAFGAEVGWQEYCREHAHEVAQLLDARRVDRVLSLYAKGLSPNHPLYRDYRSAILARDDVRAYELVTIISRLNPSDSNAGRELLRLRRKGSLQALEQMAGALERNDAAALLTLITRVEDQGDPEEYSQRPEWARALAWRADHARQAAGQRIPQLLELAEAELTKGDWRTAALHLSDQASLQELHRPDLSSAHVAQAKEIEKKIADARAEAEREAKVRACVTGLEALADEVETRSVTPEGVSADFAVQTLESMAKRSRELESLRGQVPDTLRARLSGLRTRLERTVEGRRRLKRAKLAALASVMVVTLAAGVTYGYLFSRASGFTKELESARAAGSSSSVRKVLQSLEESEPFLLKFPSLAASAGAAKQWVAEAEGRLELVSRELKFLEGARADDFQGIGSPDLMRRMEAIEGMVPGLPEDLRGEVAERMLIVRNAGEAVLHERQMAQDHRARTEIQRLEELLAKFDPRGDVATAEALVAGWGESLAPMEAGESSEDPILRLPAATATRLNDLKSRLEAVDGKIQQVRQALEALDQATQLADYRQALKALASSGFQEAELAQAAIDGWPSDEALLARILFQGDAVAYQQAKGLEGQSLPYPNTATDEDRSTLLELDDDEMLQDLWEVKWKDKGKLMKGFSRGPLEATRDRSKYAGKITELPKMGSRPKFRETRLDSYYQQQLILNKITPISALMRRLDVTSLLDDTGRRYRRSIILSIDLIMAADDVPPLARAYLLKQLSRLILGREAQFGVYLSPRLRTDLSVLEDLLQSRPVKPYSWMDSETSEDTIAWAKFFEARKGMSYREEMEGMIRTLQQIQDNPVKLAGWADPTGGHVVDAQPERRLIWGLSPAELGRSSVAFIGVSEGESFPSDRQLTPFTPLVTLDVPESAIATIIQRQTPGTKNPDELDR